ncbi:MAG: polysaccharide deacetylase family protein [Ignavibacteriales bacterium]
MKKRYILLFLSILIIILPASIIISAPNDLKKGTLSDGSVCSNVYSLQMDKVDVIAVPAVKEVKKDEVKPPVNPKKFAYLTFDDGPSPSVTPKVLKVLDECDVKATFFMLGAYVQEYPSVAKSVYNKGHAIGNHTYTHRWNKICSNFKTEINKTNSAIEKATGGSKVKLFRTPYGYKLQTGFKNHLKSLGMRTFIWNVDCKDSRAKRVPAADIYNSVAWSLDGKKDVVVILHDGKGHEQTAYALKKIIYELWRKGYGIKPLTPDVKINAKVEIK